ncbi:kinesin-like protein KIN-14P [Ziziphus jujuba]|uniref:Kinesin-like protein KIN-14P n=1 Tax=Ziziphus jujuba TaxID=326968 RepID=A0ABM4A0I1_ZIZJJ|nr:kinesin-like protein KIN-14P [Ziziphus jujuba]
MKSSSTNDKNEYSRLDNSKMAGNGDISEQTMHNNGEVAGKQRRILVEWLNSTVPNLKLPTNASDEDLRACLTGGPILCRLLNNLKPGSVNEVGDFDHSSMSGSEYVTRFLEAMDELQMPKFEQSDLEKGSMKTVIDRLLTLKSQFTSSVTGDNNSLTYSIDKSESPHGDASPRGHYSPLTGEERRKVLSESKFQRPLRSPIMSEPSAAAMHHVGHKFHEVFQLRQGRYADLPAAKLSEMMKSNSLDNAPTQSLLSVVNGILDESVDRNNGEIPHRVACLLRKVVQEIERRISAQAEHLRTQNNLFKAREEKYQSRIRVLGALASGTSEESEIVMDRLQQMKNEKANLEEKKKTEDEDVIRLMKEKDQSTLEISALKQELEINKKAYELRYLEMENKAKSAKMEVEERVKELETTKKTYEMRFLEMENQAKSSKGEVEQRLLEELETTKQMYEMRYLEMENKLRSAKEEVEQRLLKELETTKKMYEMSYLEMENKAKSARGEVEKRLKELETTEKTYEMRYLEMENKDRSAKAEVEERLKELEHFLAESRNKVKELEASSELKFHRWNKKEQSCQSCLDFQLGALQEFRFSSEAIKQEILKANRIYTDDFNRLGMKFQALANAAENYHVLLAENRKLFNEIQELKGNIRVYCRIRPFFPGQRERRTIVDYIGENGELVIANPTKQGKEGNRLFKFNKVYGPAATQAEVYSDTQPLIQSVLDGYNVCIFAYGQTGSGKTYTMTGPNAATEEKWGVNYRALNDLFFISQKRGSSISYEIGVQMVEIYNEQVRDLLSSDSQKKTLGILTHSQPNGLAVPDATMLPVKSTSDVIELMDTGLKNRAVGATALNERSSRSHSVVTIHVRGTDLKRGVALIGNLHLVDLAGSERVDRSEVVGDRLKEAQHINKSLSALGDVIFALSQKSPHVPYRNSKLTQVLQSSLGGQAKTLMFVQLNPDAISFSESLSTLKFAERVSGVELGAARSSKEGRDVRELMEQVALLKNTIAKKDEEIERLQLLKDLKNVYPGVDGGEKRVTSSLRYGSSSPSRDSVGGTPEQGRKPSGGTGLGRTEKSASDPEISGYSSDKHSEADSQQSSEDVKNQNDDIHQSKVARGDNIGQNIHADDEILGFGDGDYEERLSDLSDSGISVGTETDGSVENVILNDGAKSDNLDRTKKTLSKISRPSQRPGLTASTTASASKGSPKVVSSGMKRTSSANSLKPPSRRWQ